MATTMRAALDDGTGVYQTQDAPMPEMFEGAALIRVRQTGICGSDLHMTTTREEAQDMPSGHEVAPFAPDDFFIEDAAGLDLRRIEQLLGPVDHRPRRQQPGVAGLHRLHHGQQGEGLAWMTHQ